MRNALENLKKEVYSAGETHPLSDNAWKLFTKQCVIVLAAGGESSRFGFHAASEKIQKNIHQFPNGDTMIERTIRMYRDAGLKDFVLLVFFRAPEIIDLLGDGSRLGVRIRYSHDPEKPVGRGGAMLHALERGILPPDKTCIVHNPDDQVIRYPGVFAHDLIAGHRAGMTKGMLATAVVADGTPYTYTGMKIQEGVVTQAEMYPHIPLPTHIGVTVFDPGVYPYFKRLFDLGKKADFESILFPALVAEQRLYSFAVPTKHWLPVNDQKAFTKLTEVMQEEGSI
ncbi:MAG: NTP transferase domain-containing protein [Candidatus Sungbacteria bacterium]|nr:NTP transferase domain-containing protein [Candidatus Sungbacteria bacterium]